MSTKHKKTDDPSEVHLPSTWPLGRPPRPWLCPRTQQKTQWPPAPKTPSPWMGSFRNELCARPSLPKVLLFVNSRAKSGWVAACWSPRMDCKILLRAPGRLLHAAKDELFGNCSASWSQIFPGHFYIFTAHFTMHTQLQLLSLSCAAWFTVCEP